MYGGGEDRQADSDASIILWERLETLAGSALGMFTPADVEAAMKASNFNKGLGPDGFDGTFLRPGDPSHIIRTSQPKSLPSLTTQPQFHNISMTGDLCHSPRTKDWTRRS